MTVTISRLYDDYASASRAVTELEAAGIPHSDISIIANNSENWYATDRTGSRTTARDQPRIKRRRKWTVIAMALTIAPKVRRPVAASAPQ